MTDVGLAARVAAMVGADVVGVDPIDRGHLANRRYRVRLEDGHSVFVKEPTSPFTEDVLAGERRAYESLAGRPFMPTYINSSDRLLVVEDLGHAYWPPPWRTDDLDAALLLIEQIGATAGPAPLRDLADDTRHRVWWKVAANPAPFLELNECTEEWFADSIEALVETDACPLGGGSLVHGDLRSDNLCILDGTAIAVDWGAAARGRPDYDLVGFAVSTAAELAVRPETIAPRADPALVAVFAGTFAHASVSPGVPASIRHQLHGYLRIALPWTARLLDLPPPSFEV